MTLKFKLIESPVGQLKLVADEQVLLAVLWDKERMNRVRLEAMEETNSHAILREAEQQLKEYFSGKLRKFDLPMNAKGTPFQEAVWDVLTFIPYGSTWTYKQVAEKIKNPSAVRAVGAAIGRNPISIIVPCHRVIATNGSLTGFAGGLDRKKTLLTLEIPESQSLEC